MKDVLPTLRWSVGGLIVIGVLSRILGLLREVLIANYFGISADLDAVYLGLAAPLMLAVGVGGGLSRAVVPVAARLSPSRYAGLMREGLKGVIRFFAPLSLGMALTSPLWARWLYIGGETPSVRPLLWSAALGSLAILGAAISGFYRGLANAKGRHVGGSLNLLAYNGIVCACLFLFHRSLGAMALLAGIVAAEWAQVFILWDVAQRVSARVRPLHQPADFQRLYVLFWPTILIGTAQGVNVTVDRAFASLLDSGAIAALVYGERLVNLPATLLAMALSVPLYTRLSRFHKEKREKAFRDTMDLGIRLLLLAGLPGGVILAGISHPLVGIILQRGAFDEAAVWLTSLAMIGYGFGIAFTAINALLIGAGLSMEKPWPVLRILVYTAILNAVLDYILVHTHGIMGIALATTIVALVRTVWLLSAVCPSLLRQRGTLSLAGKLLFVAAALGAALLMFQQLTGVLTASTLSIRIASILAAGAVSAAVLLASWTPLLRKEWKNIQRLRGRAASYAREEAR